jgi:osmotically-inducible protein OsmY
MRPFNPNRPVLLLSSMVLVAALPLAANDTDQRIEASVKSSYNFMTYLREDAIKVQCAGGVVTLTGTVSQEFHRALAEETASAMPGVTRVDNQLGTADAMPPERSDAWISMKVKSALTFHKHVSATETGVHTDNGVVTLSGTAISKAQKELTGEYAKEVEGVTAVRNNLVVGRPGRTAHDTMKGKIDDASITAQVKTALLFHRGTHILSTKVDTRNGVVTLRGETRTAAERDLAVRLAEDVDGVKLVTNHLSVKK